MRTSGRPSTGLLTVSGNEEGTMTVGVTSSVRRIPELDGQTVLVIGGSSGMGLATAVRARDEGADLILTARDADRLATAGRTVDTRALATFDATDAEALGGFFAGLDVTLDHVMVTAGHPAYGELLKLGDDELSAALSQRLVQVVQVCRLAAGHLRPGGSLVFIGGTGGRRPALGIGPQSTVIVALPTLIANLALELAPIRVNLIAPGFVDTGLSAAVLGDGLQARRDQLRATLPIRRVVEADDIGRLAVHLMVNTALTGATFDIDGGQQFVE
jgi:NAD(P)-dependent dehydrogenase (short-subunit alcohol dehydrogenase family)